MVVTAGVTVVVRAVLTEVETVVARVEDTVVAPVAEVPVVATVARAVVGKEMHNSRVLPAHMDCSPHQLGQSISPSIP